MGERIPLSWVQASAAMQQEQVKCALGDAVLSLTDAAAKLSAALQLELPGVEVEAARGLDSRDLLDCLEFWSELGRVFVHDEHFLRDPRLVIELLKPLVHHNVLSEDYRREFCSSECMHLKMLDGLLDNLQQRAILDHRLLSYYKAWPKSKPAIDTMLRFFKECFMISSLEHDDVTDDDSDSSLVTARLCDSSDSGRQQAVRDKAADIEGTSQFFAVYVVPLDHIGIIARMQATVGKRPSSPNLWTLPPVASNSCKSFARSHQPSLASGVRKHAETYRSLPHVDANPQLFAYNSIAILY
jgi:hypothetical protein